MTESPEIGVDDSWIKKIDPEGTTIFTRHYNMNILDEARSIIQVDDGTFVMGGATEPYGETFPQDAAIIQVDREGNMLWNMSFGDQMLQETVEDIATRPDGGYIFSGHVEAWRTGSMEGLLEEFSEKMRFWPNLIDLYEAMAARDESRVEAGDHRIEDLPVDVLEHRPRHDSFDASDGRQRLAHILDVHVRDFPLEAPGERNRIPARDK